jgi:hypothetical protein
MKTKIAMFGVVALLFAAALHTHNGALAGNAGPIRAEQHSSALQAVESHADANASVDVKRLQKQMKALELRLVEQEQQGKSRSQAEPSTDRSEERASGPSLSDAEVQARMTASYEKVMQSATTSTPAEAENVASIQAYFATMPDVGSLEALDCRGGLCRLTVRPVPTARNAGMRLMGAGPFKYGSFFYTAPDGAIVAYAGTLGHPLPTTIPGDVEVSEGISRAP